MDIFSVITNYRIKLLLFLLLLLLLLLTYIDIFGDCVHVEIIRYVVQKYSV